MLRDNTCSHPHLAKESGASYYPYVTDGIHLWLHPKGAILQYIRDDGFPDPADRRDLTPFALRCLRLCQGDLTFAEILSKIHQEVEGVGFDATQAASGFLVEMLRDGVLSVTDRPEFHSCPERGSSDYVRPMHFSIEVTDRCNLACSHCYRNSSPASSCYLDTDRLIHLMDEAAVMGVCTVELTGGEPTLHPDFVKLAQHAYTRFSLIAVLTNGTTLKEKMLTSLDETRERLIFQVDLDGANAEQHEYLRGLKGSYDAAINAIRILSSHGFRFRAAMNVYRDNVCAVEETCHRAIKLGATWFSASPVLDIGRGHPDLTLQSKDIHELYGAIRRLHKQYPHAILLVEQLQDLKKELGGNCGAGWRSLTLGPDASIRPCVMFPIDTFSFGNVKTAGLSDILQKTDLKYFLELKPPGKEICGDCLLEPFCRGCFARPWYGLRRARERGMPLTCRWAAETGFDQKIPGFYPASMQNTPTASSATKEP